MSTLNFRAMVFALFLGLFGFPFLAEAQDSLNMRRLAQWNPLNPTGNPSTNRYNEVWGYADETGEYAILGSLDSIHFIDLRDPSSPQRIDAFAGGGTTIWRDIKTYGHYAFAGSEHTGEGLMIFDLQNLPHSVTKVYQSDSLFYRSHNIFIDTSRAVLYAVGGRKYGWGSRNLIAVDISDPVNPEELFHTQLPGGYIHDMYASRDTLYCNHGSFNSSLNELLVYQCDDQGCAQIGGIYSYPQEGYNHSCWVNQDGSKIVWADESHNRSLKVADIVVNPSASPEEKIELQIQSLFRSKLLEPVTGDTASIAHNPLIRGDSVYVSYYHDGVAIFDISDPTEVIKVAYYDTYPSNVNYQSYKGCWGVYPFLPSGIVLASDRSGGLFVLEMMSPPDESQPSDTVRYTASEEPFRNPERGLMPLTASYSSDFAPLSGDSLVLWSEAYRPPGGTRTFPTSVLHRVYYLDSFVSVPISQSFLDHIDQDLSLLRDFGFKVVLRFTYKDMTSPCVSGPCSPYGDATLSQVLSHIDQLTEVWQSHEDVMLAVELGFIGLNGESVYSDFFGAPTQVNGGELTLQNWQDRNQVLGHLLESLPSTVEVLVPFPQIKQKYIYGPESGTDSGPMDSTQAYTAEDVARIGFVSPYFQYDELDSIFYVDYDSVAVGDTAELRPYVASDSRYTWMVGLLDPSSGALSTCDTASHPALKEVEMLHLSLLGVKSGQDTSMYDSLCFLPIPGRLGYQLELVEAVIPDTAEHGHSFSISLSIQNTGVVAPQNPRPVQIVWKHQASSGVWKYQLDVDLRHWTPGAHWVTWDLTPRPCMPEGEYDLYLAFPDPALELAQNPDYSIRLANEGLWDTITGWNSLLHTISLAAAVDSTESPILGGLSVDLSSNIWIGPATGHWYASADNWSLGRFPDICDPVYIPPGHFVSVLAGQTARAKTLDIPIDAHLDVELGAVIEVMSDDN